MFTTKALHQIPVPTGPHKVGFVSYQLTNINQVEFHNNDLEHPYRELVMNIHYPACPTDKYTKNKYVPDILTYVKQDIAKHYNKDITQLSYLDTLTTHALQQAPAHAHLAPYPVIIFTHGTETSSQLHTMLIEDLASHGFIIVSIEHPYTALAVSLPGRVISAADNKTEYASFPDYISKEIAIRLSDIAFVIDELKRITSNDPLHILTNMLDMTKIGLMGHSFGGSVMIRLCQQQNLFKAGVSIDGPLYGKTTSLNNPFMFIRGAFLNGTFFTDQELKHFNLSKEDGLMIAQAYEEIPDLLKTVQPDMYYISLAKMQHMDFSDYGVLVSGNTQATSFYPLIIDFFTTYLK